MTLVLGHISALEYWLAHPASKPPARTVSASFSLPSSAPSKMELLQLEDMVPKVFSSPVHVISSSPIKADNPKLAIPHKHSVATFGAAFCHLGNDVYVSSIELAFVQMARDLPLIDLVRLGFELCGGYSLSIAHDKGFFKRQAPTSMRQLQTFAEKSPGLKGRNPALRAIRHVLSDSASPAETNLAMTLSLPYHLGGFGLPQPALNHRVKLSPAEQNLVGKPYLKCDLYWPDRRVGVEYDSDLEHTGSARIASDARRRNTLTLTDTTLMTVTRIQYNDFRQLSATAAALAKLLRRRLQPTCKDYEAKQRRLRDALYQSPEWEIRKAHHPLRRALSEQ